MRIQAINKINIINLIRYLGYLGLLMILTVFNPVFIASSYANYFMPSTISDLNGYSGSGKLIGGSSHKHDNNNNNDDDDDDDDDILINTPSVCDEFVFSSDKLRKICVKYCDKLNCDEVFNQENPQCTVDYAKDLQKCTSQQVKYDNYKLDSDPNLSCNPLPPCPCDIAGLITARAEGGQNICTSETNSYFFFHALNDPNSISISTFDPNTNNVNGEVFALTSTNPATCRGFTSSSGFVTINTLTEGEVESCYNIIKDEAALNNVPDCDNL